MNTLLVSDMKMNGRKMEAMRAAKTYANTLIFRLIPSYQLVETTETSLQ
ncbi:MAG: hypothetical protein KIH01_05410 [Candidatus Freyarchaeota archaeon]|nr:hypothetical protein [Candidatus Jordarchaeia archaeon]